MLLSIPMFQIAEEMQNTINRVELLTATLCVKIAKAAVNAVNAGHYDNFAHAWVSIAIGLTDDADSMSITATANEDLVAVAFDDPKWWGIDVKWDRITEVIDVKFHTWFVEFYELTDPYDVLEHAEIRVTRWIEERLARD